MEQQYPVLIVIIPMFTAMVLTLAGWFKPAVCQPLAVVGLLGSFLSAVATLLQIGAGEVISYRLGGWEPPFGIEYRVDSLNALVLVMVSLVALLVPLSLFLHLFLSMLLSLVSLLLSILVPCPLGAV